MAVKAEHGNRHSAHLHSKNVDHMTQYAKAICTTIFVKNAPSYAGIGFNAEGWTTFTIAGPTGEVSLLREVLHVREDAYFQTHLISYKKE